MNYNKQAFFFTIFSVLFALLFFFFEPKIGKILTKTTNAKFLNVFLTKTETTKHIEPRMYWEMREFYSPGYFRFERTGVSKTLIDPGLQTFLQTEMRVFATYSSPHLHSIDTLVPFTTISSALVNLHPAKILISTPTLFLGQDGTNYTLVFLLPIDQMKTANGFFTYDDRDAAILQGKQWLNVSRIETQ